MTHILPGHGSGGKLMNEMIDSVIRETLGPDSIQLDDSAILDIPAGRIAFTTDTFTITPLIFPGGTIGTLAINGTVNDLAVMGATPKYLTCGLILEEGLDMDVLQQVLTSMKQEADGAGVQIVTGDTKVVPHGKGDGIFINTAGIGILEGPPLRGEIRPNDVIIVNGTIGDHGMSIMAHRNNLSFSEGLPSDCAHLNHMIADMRATAGDSIRFVRDATRGGVASVLNEIVKNRSYSARLDETLLPIRKESHAISNILGIDPLYAANEGKIVTVAAKEAAEDILAAMRRHHEGKEAAIIGNIEETYPGKAWLETGIGGHRILPLLIEEQLPRIC